MSDDVQMRPRQCIRTWSNPALTPPAFKRSIQRAMAEHTRNALNPN